MAFNYTSAAALVDRGDYAQALPALKCLADRGQGYEIAQYLAGYASVRMAEADTTPDILRPELRTEGFDRLRSAAGAGWPSAQAELARLYWQAGTHEALQEAAYWAEVYRGNRRDRSLGLDRLSNGVEAEIRAALDTATLDRIETDAGAFSLTPMEARPLSQECTQLLSRGQRMSGNGMRRPGGRGQGGGGRGGGRPPM